MVTDLSKSFEEMVEHEGGYFLYVGRDGALGDVWFKPHCNHCGNELFDDGEAVYVHGLDADARQCWTIRQDVGK